MFYFFNVTATSELYTYLHTLSLHDALPIFRLGRGRWCALVLALEGRAVQVRGEWEGVIEQKLCSSPFGYPHARSHRSPGRGRPRSRTCARLYPCRCATTRRPGLWHRCRQHRAPSRTRKPGHAARPRDHGRSWRREPETYASQTLIAAWMAARGIPYVTVRY